MEYRKRQCDRCRRLIDGDDLDFEFHYEQCVKRLRPEEIKAIEERLATPTNKIQTEQGWIELHNWAGNH